MEGELRKQIFKEAPSCRPKKFIRLGIIQLCINTNDKQNSKKLKIIMMGEK
jgi:hypothetical protein